MTAMTPGQDDFEVSLIGFLGLGGANLFIFTTFSFANTRLLDFHFDIQHKWPTLLPLECRREDAANFHFAI